MSPTRRHLIAGAAAIALGARTAPARSAPVLRVTLGLFMLGRPAGGISSLAIEGGRPTFINAEAGKLTDHIEAISELVATAERAATA